MLPSFNEVNKDLCEALGLNAADVRSVLIRMNPGEYPTVLVEFGIGYLSRHPGVRNVWEQYELVPRKPKAEDAA